MASRVLFLFVLVMVSTGAEARIWEVGPGLELSRPSQAAEQARDGDTVRIAPGDYADCAVWRADRLTIEGRGRVVLDGPVCEGKALFVVEGRDTIIRGIGFAHARAEDGNGAGIRGEGVNLTIEDSRFDDNQDGLLAGDNAASTIIVRASNFTGNGVCAPVCAHGIYVNHVARLVVEHSTFLGQKQGHHIKSRAAMNEITANVIRDGADGTASYAVDIPDGGGLLLKDNVIEKGPKAGNRVAVSIGEEGHGNPASPLTVTGNEFVGDGGPAVFVRNGTGVAATLSGNRTKGAVTVLAGPGQVTP
jgi:hypothetical protein